jgi:hypothetical protein
MKHKQDKISGKIHPMIMIIDGHNLIPKIPGLSLLQMDDENQLLTILQDYSRLRRKKLEVFFDRAPVGQSGTLMVGTIRVIHVSEKTTADEEIIHRIRRAGIKAKELIVISSDHHIQNQVKALGAQVMTSELFVQELYAGLAGSGSRKSGNKPDRKLSEDEILEWADLFNSAPPEKYSDKD